MWLQESVHYCTEWLCSLRSVAAFTFVTVAIQMTELGKCVERGETKALLAWFEKGVALCGRTAAESNAVVEIRYDF